MIGIRLAAACKCTAGGAPMVVGDLGWNLALEQPQRPGLAADVVPGLQRGWVWRKQEGTQGAGVNECEHMWGENW